MFNLIGFFKGFKQELVEAKRVLLEEIMQPALAPWIKLFKPHTKVWVPTPDEETVLSASTHLSKPNIQKKTYIYSELSKVGEDKTETGRGITGFTGSSKAYYEPVAKKVMEVALKKNVENPFTLLRGKFDNKYAPMPEEVYLQVAAAYLEAGDKGTPIEGLKLPLQVDPVATGVLDSVEMKDQKLTLIFKHALVHVIKVDENYNTVQLASFRAERKVEILPSLDSVDVVVTSTFKRFM